MHNDQHEHQAHEHTQVLLLSLAIVSTIYTFQWQVTNAVVGEQSSPSQQFSWVTSMNFLGPLQHDNHGVGLCSVIDTMRLSPRTTTAVHLNTAITNTVVALDRSMASSLQQGMHIRM